MARVLLVDDEEELRTMMARQLVRTGHQVITAVDGLAAAALLEQDIFDVVVSDMKMPRLDGMGLLARSTELAPDTEFVILTGHGSMENAVEAFKTGRVFDYLLKPLEDIRELGAVVARAAERRHLRQENSRLAAELADLAIRDGLTGLFNHRAMHQELEAAIAHAQGEPVSVMLMDMDGFKLFNDTYGHPLGDEVLRHVANALKSAFGADAILGRCGGDEFMVVMPATRAAKAGEMAEGFYAFIEQRPFQTPDGTVPLRLCAGIADTQSAGLFPPSVVAAADCALYNGKHHGGGYITVDDHDKDKLPIGPRITKFDSLDALVAIIDNKDHYTRKHSEDVTSYAVKLVEALGLSEDTRNAVCVAGLLHDVGKVGIPDAILRKPGKLTNEEYDIMKTHVTLSSLIINGLPRLTDIMDAVSNHHEHWDGTGYPTGIAGEDIPLLGRIMAIADAFSAMTVSRPYRTAKSVEDALAEMEACAGTQFDPQLVKTFVETIRPSHMNNLRIAA